MHRQHRPYKALTNIPCVLDLKSQLSQEVDGRQTEMNTLWNVYAILMKKSL